MVAFLVITFLGWSYRQYSSELSYWGFDIYSQIGYKPINLQTHPISRGKGAEDRSKVAVERLRWRFLEGRIAEQA